MGGAFRPSRKVCFSWIFGYALGQRAFDSELDIPCPGPSWVTHRALWRGVQREISVFYAPPGSWYKVSLVNPTYNGGKHLTS